MRNTLLNLLVDVFFNAGQDGIELLGINIILINIIKTKSVGVDRTASLDRRQIKVDIRNRRGRGERLNGAVIS